MRRSALNRLDGTDAEGRSVTIPLGSVLAVTPDRANANRTFVHAAEGIVAVDGDDESWMSRLSADWIGAPRQG